MNKYFPNIYSVLLFTFFVVYIGLLLYFLFFARMGLASSGFNHSHNLIPFNTINKQLYQLNTQFRAFAMANLVINMFMLTPLGVYIPLFGKSNKVFMHMVCIFMFSLCIEVGQGFFRLGAADIDDVILNCLGGFLGLIIYKILQVLLKNKQAIRVFVAIASTMVGVLFAIFLLTYR